MEPKSFVEPKKPEPPEARTIGDTLIDKICYYILSSLVIFLCIWMLIIITYYIMTKRL